jgi:AcrR family transcriptional regulator
MIPVRGSIPASSLTPSPEGPRTRERLLDTAEDLFAARGYRGTSVRHITSRAGCNLAAVNYHFGGKLNLYREMFRRRLGEVRERRIAAIQRVAEEAGGRATLESLLHAFTAAFLEPHLDEKRGRILMRLFAHEVADPHLPPDTFREEMLEPMLEEMTRTLSLVCPGLKGRAARRSIQSVVAQLVQVVQMRQMPAPARHKGAGDFALPQIIDHIVRFSAAGMRSCGE